MQESHAPVQLTGSEAYAQRPLDSRSGSRDFRSGSIRTGVRGGNADFARHAYDEGDDDERRHRYEGP